MPGWWQPVGGAVFAGVQRGISTVFTAGQSDLASKVALCAATDGLGAGFIVSVGPVSFLGGLVCGCCCLGVLINGSILWRHHAAESRGEPGRAGRWGGDRRGNTRRISGSFTSDSSSTRVPPRC